MSESLRKSRLSVSGRGGGDNFNTSGRSGFGGEGDSYSAPGTGGEEIATNDARSRQQRQGIAFCDICFDDYAFYRCLECGTQPTHFCETCWNVVHAPSGERAAHEKAGYKVENPDLRTYHPKFEKLYKEVMATKHRVPALDVYIVTVLVVIFLAYPSVITQIAVLMKCTYISSLGKSYLEADYSIDCGTAEYKHWSTIAKAFFFLYGLGIPLGGCLLLFIKRKTLLHKKTLSTYGFLYSGYRLKCYFWEFVIMFRKMFVVFVVVFYGGDSDYSTMFGMWLVLMFLILNIMVQPFQLRLYWRLENVSLTAITITLNAAMLYQPRFNLDSTNETLLTVFIFIVNLLVLIMFLYYIVIAGKIHFMVMFDLDGNGDVTWDEFKLVVRYRIYQTYGETLTGWGFKMEDPTPQIDEMKRQKLIIKQKKAAEAWMRVEAARAGAEGFDGIATAVLTEEQEEEEEYEDAAAEAEDAVSAPLSLVQDAPTTKQPLISFGVGERRSRSTVSPVTDEGQSGGQGSFELALSSHEFQQQNSAELSLQQQASGTTTSVAPEDNSKKVVRVRRKANVVASEGGDKPKESTSFSSGDAAVE